MSYATLILGESGTGKTASLRNLNPKNTLLIQPVRKPLPFRAKNWHEIKSKGDGGNIFVCNDAQKIVACMKRAPQDVIVIDDWQYILSSQFMARRNEKSFDKFTDIGGAGYDIVQAASQLAENKRVYVLAHTATDEMGNVRIKTLGKLLDEKIVVEGMFTTVLRTFVDPGTGYFFLTHNNGHDTVKSPMGMFKENQVENDLAAIDDVICDYYGISEETSEKPQESTEKVTKIPKISPELEQKLSEFQEKIHATMDMNELKKIGAEIKALGLPDESTERKELLSAWEKQKQRILDTLNDL